MTNSITGYNGMQVIQDYYALQLGAAVGTPIGAVAFGVTQARAHLQNSTDENGHHEAGNSLSGQSYQVSYSKLITETNSNLSLAAYRFSTDGYMDFMTAMQTRDAVARGILQILSGALKPSDAHGRSTMYILNPVIKGQQQTQIQQFNSACQPVAGPEMNAHYSVSA